MTVEVDDGDHQDVGEVEEVRGSGGIEESMEEFEEYFDHHVAGKDFPGVVKGSEEDL